MASQVLPVPTASTPDLLAVALALLRSLYRPGSAYRKAGVWLKDMTPQAVIQPDLFNAFNEDREQRNRRLMHAIDTINEQWGPDTIFFGLQGIPAQRRWHMRQARRSARCTTRWEELLVVYAR